MLYNSFILLHYIIASFFLSFFSCFKKQLYKTIYSFFNTISPTQEENTFFLKHTWHFIQDRPFVRPQHRLQINLKSLEVTQSMYSVHSGTRLEISKIIINLGNMWILNNRFLNKQWVKEEIKMKIRKYFAMNEKKKTNKPILMGCCSSYDVMV